MIKITFLGTGAAWGHPVAAKHDCQSCSTAIKWGGKNLRGRSSFVVNAGGKNLLIDAGPDIRTGLLRSGISTIDAVLITHAHADHTAGMDDLMPFGTEAKLPLYCSGPVKEQLLGRAPYLSSRIDFFDVPAMEDFTLPGSAMKIWPVPVYHGPAKFGSAGSLGYVIDLHGLRVAYSGDLYSFGAERNEAFEVPSVFTRPDLLIFETNWFNEPKQQPGNPHMSFQRALRYFEKINAQKVVLTHISHEDWSIGDNHDHLRKDKMLVYPPPLDHDQWQGQVRNKYASAEVAYDGMVVRVSD